MTEGTDNPCEEGEHRILKDGNGFDACARCGLTAQYIQGWIGHDIGDEEYDVEGN